MNNLKKFHVCVEGWVYAEEIGDFLEYVAEVVSQSNVAKGETEVMMESPVYGGLVRFSVKEIE